MPVIRRNMAMNEEALEQERIYSQDTDLRRHRGAPVFIDEN